jgi:hypothetical protein
MAQGGNSFGLTAKTLHKIGVLGQMTMNNFDGNITLKHGVEGPIDIGHSPLSQKFFDLIFTELPGLQIRHSLNPGLKQILREILKS